MPIKYFCDVCGEETKRNYVSERLKPELSHDSGKVVCEVMVFINGTTNGGVICEKCLRAALTQPEKKNKMGIVEDMIKERDWIDEEKALIVYYSSRGYSEVAAIDMAQREIEKRKIEVGVFF